MKKKTIIMLSVIAVAAIAAVTAYHPIMEAIESRDSEAEIEALETYAPKGPAFNADSAYVFTQVQCNFGPRAMNTEAHDRCGEWIIHKFKQYGCKSRRLICGATTVRFYTVATSWLLISQS